MPKGIQPKTVYIETLLNYPRTHAIRLKQRDKQRRMREDMDIRRMRSRVLRGGQWLSVADTMAKTEKKVS